ncbi:endolytic transglycosylase MltG [Sediminicoccus sp. KRV36]|uniref:endolytic transglycosylase MltG n=1 Tax=Sediminicoccus sp. KRV36 TaxID=3133721 RepID=UPI0020103EA2|nr:endolytic transglycosylase MltG [Sediminicoccus rosea]UPY36367.1 endolytic transglycosylase MltG [Sediminicoccus rosea]
MRRLMKLAGVALLALTLLGTGAGWAGWNLLHHDGPLAEPRAVVIPRGGTEAIASTLREAGVVADARIFALAAWWTRAEGPLRAGEFPFPAQASLRAVLSILREGRMVQRRFTIAEGLTARQITALLERVEGLVGDVPPLAEGAALPETYAYSWGDARAAVARRAMAAMDAALAEAWAARAPNLPLANPREALILASIIERETGVAGERALVGGVFVNRLRRGMMLQSDPTVAYVPGQGLPLDRPLTRADLDQAHPFNTYRIRGLPPAPIASPGREALRAATRPAETEFLYFVADGTGGHAFARTLEEHNRNVARWRALR